MATRLYMIVNQGQVLVRENQDLPETEVGTCILDGVPQGDMPELAQPERFIVQDLQDLGIVADLDCSVFCPQAGFSTGLTRH